MFGPNRTDVDKIQWKTHILHLFRGGLLSDFLGETAILAETYCFTYGIQAKWHPKTPGKHALAP